MDLPPELKERIAADLKSAADATYGQPLIEELVTTAVAARYVYHTLTQSNGSLAPVPEASAAQMTMQIMGTYNGLSGMALAERYQGYKPTHFSISG